MAWETTRWLAVSREQSRRMCEGAPVPHMTIDSNGEIKEPNKAALRFFGVAPEEIEGKNIFSFQPEEDRNESDRLLQRYKSNIPINREEVRFITKKGETKFALLSIFEIRNTGSFTRSGLATIFDITEQKQLDKAKTEFVSLTSHQLRTPLATIKWFTDLLLSGDIGNIPPKQKEYLERLHMVNEGMIDIVEVLLNVSRIEIGTLPIDLKPTNVQGLIETIFTELSSQINLKKIHIIKQYDGYLKNIQSDPKLLRIVIQNLISNAVKYTPEGGTVTITLKESTKAKSIVVSDTGYGIPQEQQNRVFEKLFRADNVRKLSSQGTGLGLYLVKSIIEALGGSISFESRENKGSMFTITM